MREDILKQLVDDYLQFKGYFTRTNVKFRPRKDHPDFDRLSDSNHSDIDVLGFHPQLSAPDAVWAVSCQSWQAEFSVPSKLAEIEEDKTRSGRKVWKAFRELVQPKWSEAFRRKVRSLTGRDEFTYLTAVTHLKGQPELWQQHPRFKESMAGNPVRLVALHELLDEMVPALSTTMASLQLGRTLQLLKAADVLETRPGSSVQTPDPTAPCNRFGLTPRRSMPKGSQSSGTGARPGARPEHILVIAPYNARPRRCGRSFPTTHERGHCGQARGSGAPVVIQSTVVSSVQDQPRSMEFSFISNHLNVATSRTRCVVIVVETAEVLGPVPIRRSFPQMTLPKGLVGSSR